MKGFVEKNAEVLKMMGAMLVVTASAVWVLSHEMQGMENRLNDKIGSLDKRLTVVETVLILQGYPIKNLATNTDLSAP